MDQIFKALALNFLFTKPSHTLSKAMAIQPIRAVCDHARRTIFRYRFEDREETR